ncbi:hypothetical protein ACVMGE_003201 [Bradyrhizobium diazoefficiens]
MQLVDDRRRRARGREQAGESLAVEILVAELGEGRDVRQRLQPVRAGDRERAEQAGLDVLEADRELVERELHLAAEQIVDGRRVAAVMRGDPLQVEIRLHQFAEQMIGGAGAGRGHRQLTGLALGEVDEFLEIVGLDGGMHLEHQRRHRDGRDRQEILLPVIGIALVDLGREQHRAVGADEQRIAVGRRFRESLARDHAAGAGLVLDDEGLTELFLELVGDDARGAVDIAAGRIGHDQLDAARRPLLGRCGPRQHRRDSGYGNRD